MVEIIQVTDLPTATQAAELVDVMVAAANARASRVAPCLTPPSDAWAAETEYEEGATVLLTGDEALEVTTAGTSGTEEPTAPAWGQTVEDGTVTWTRIAPTPEHLAEAKLVLIGAVKRWSEAGSGALQQQTAGPFGVSVDTRQRTGYHLWPSEIEQLQELCREVAATGGAFTIDTTSTNTETFDPEWWWTTPTTYGVLP